MDDVARRQGARNCQSWTICPEWLGRYAIETLEAVAFAAAIPVSLGLLLSKLMAAGASFPAAFALETLLLAGIGVVSAWMLLTRKRLRLADAGQSPFSGLLPKLPGEEPPTAPAA